MEFQNWKRRKSYDPMKAAAEGKKKAELAKKQNQNTTLQFSVDGNQDCDSSPSHSSSVHRSQVRANKTKCCLLLFMYLIYV